MAASDTFYIEVKKEVDAVLAEFGTQFYTRGVAVYDPETMETTAAVTKTVTGIVANQQQVIDMAGQLGSTWTALKTLILEADSETLKGEEVKVDGRWFSLSKIVAIKPADIVVVYLLDIS